jgi:anti-anti-sigma factor
MRPCCRSWSSRECVEPADSGQSAGVEEHSTGAEPVGADVHEPRVTVHTEHGTAVVTVEGELSEAARRPVVRVVTDLLLADHSLERLELDLRGVSFANSAGLAVLVQVQRMAAPRGIHVVLVAPPSAVLRPLQLSGLWQRFEVVDADPGYGGTRARH